MASNTFVVKNDLVVSSTTPSTSATTGALVVQGGLGVSGTLSCGTLSTTTSALQTLTLSGTTDATSTSTGTLRVTGGASVGKALYVGGSEVVSGNLQVNATSGIGTQTPSILTCPISTGAEASVGFSQNIGTGVGAGDLWVCGRNLGESTGNFSLYNSTLNGKLLSCTSSGDLLIRSDSGTLVSMQPSRDDQFKQPTSFTGAQSVASPANVTGLSVSTGSRGFLALVHVAVSATASPSATYYLQGSYDGSVWSLSQYYVGGDTQVTFSITSAGAVQYTSGTYAGYSSLTMRWRLLSLHV